MTSIRRLVAVLVLGAIVLTAGGLTTGRIAHVTTSGVSMEPTYAAGDLVVVGRSASYDVGDIVAFRIAGDDTLVLHRIISGDDTGFTLQGDNNESIDPYQPTADEIVGRELLHVPRLGALIASPFTRAAVLVILIALGVLLMSPRRSTPTTAEAAPAAAPARRTRLAWKIVLGVDVALMVALVLAQVVAVQGQSSPDRDAAPTQSAELAYHADVGRSATYPTGVVSTGDPVFTQLVDRVDVEFRYRTDATEPISGTAHVDLTLSTPSGWQTSRRLVQPTTIEAGNLDLDTTLVLSDIEALASEVTEATGISTATVDVAVTAAGEASIHGADPVAFSVELPLELSPLAMTLTGQTTDTPDGPAVASSSPLADLESEGNRGGSSPDRRSALLAALLVALAATVVLWPTTEDAASEARPATLHALNVQLPTTTPRVRVVDRDDVHAIAATASRPVIIGDGWEGTLTPDALYWHDSRTGESAPPAGPNTHMRRRREHSHGPRTPTAVNTS